ncbi:MAG: M15 family metallopeptidase [Lachnospiraceae bacterium]|nr:M15 family metallopeptidase [Lachnospiraceae bacterium]
MKRTFREKVMFKCMGIAKKHKLLKYPSLLVMAIMLGGYYVCRHFATNGKRYAGIAFAMLFFMSSCSFSFAVFSQQNAFISTQETYNAVVEDSDVALAVEKEVSPEDTALLEFDEEEILKEYETEEDFTNVDSYTLDDILEDEENHAAYEVQSETIEETGEIPVFDKNDWRLLLVNKQHPIPEDYTFTLGTIKGSMQCDERIISDVFAMLQAAKKDGVNLAICSPYRDLNRQEILFDRKITLYMGQGYSYMEAYKTASQTVTIPGASEHQLGLALDIFSDTYTSLDEGFGDTEAGKWLAEHSCEYGFVLRYPKGKEYITSIEYEPWHFRYVGKEAATIMTQENICLEEFWDKYL